MVRTAKRVYTARILVGFNLHIGFKVCAARR